MKQGDYAQCNELDLGKQTYYMISLVYVESEKVKLIKAENSISVARGYREGEVRRCWLRVQNCRDPQHGDYSL